MFNDIIDDIILIRLPSGVIAKVRVIFADGSFLDIYWSASGNYNLHYERRRIDGRIYRHDNAPHERHKEVPSFPKHYHYGSESNVIESNLPDDPIEAVKEFLHLIRAIIKNVRQK